MHIFNFFHDHKEMEVIIHSKASFEDKIPKAQESSDYI